jgi:hypothetical protein
MESQPLEDDSMYTISKKNDKKWVSVTSLALSNGTKITLTCTFVDVHGTVHALTVPASVKALREFHGCVPIDDDDQILASNELYDTFKYNTESLQEQKVAFAKAAKVRVYFDLLKL